jgi:hypothetical protein
MAKGKAVTKGPAAPERDSAKAGNNVEPMVIALAEQLGSFLGRAQKKADRLLENDTVRQQVSQIRDGAAALLKQVNEMRGSVAKSAPVKKAKAQSARPSRKPAAPKRQGRGGEGRSGGAVDAPGKRHRKPPPQELFDPRLGEPMGKQMGQKSLKRRGRG